MKSFVNSFLLFIAISLASVEFGKAQVIVNPDGTHSVLHGNVLVNPDGSHSVLHGNIMVNPNGTHSVIPLTAPSGNLLNHSGGSVGSQFSHWILSLFARKDKTNLKQDKEDRQRARGKLSIRRYSNPK